MIYLTINLTEYIAKHLFERSLFYDKATYKISIDDKEVQDIVTEIRILITLKML